MAICMYCNAQIADGLKFCTSCGAALPVEAPFEATVVEASVPQPAQQPGTFQPDAAQPFQQPSFGQPYGQQGAQQPYGQQGAQQPYGQQPQFAAPASQVAYDSGSIGWGVLGFFFPLVGLILFLVWRNTRPQSSKVAGIGALIGFCLSFVMNTWVFRLW